MTAVEHREDLQCCPECGATQMHEQFKDVEVVEIRIRNGLYRVHCTRCGADGPEALRRQDAAKKWNVSGTSSTAPEEQDALERENARLRSELEAKMEDGYSPRLPNPHDY